MNKIKEMREKNGLSQQEFAKMICVSRSTISMWETGRTSPTAKRCLKVALVLNCTVDELLKEEKTK